MRQPRTRAAVLAFAAWLVALALVANPASALYRQKLHFGSKGSAAARFGVSSPADVAANPATGDVYVTDPANFRVEKWTALGKHLATWGGHGNEPGHFQGDQGGANCTFFVCGLEPGDFGPIGLGVDPGKQDVYVADNGAGGFGNDDRVERFDRDGRFRSQYKEDGMTWPEDVAVDRFGHALVPDLEQHHVVVFNTASGDELFRFGEKGKGFPNLYYPRFIAIDTVHHRSDGSIDVYVTDHRKVTRWRELNGATFPIFTPIDSFPVRTPKGHTHLVPTGVAVGPNGQVLVSTAHRIEVFTPKGRLLASFAHDANAQFGGMTVGAHDLLYVADAGHNRVTAFAPHFPTVTIASHPDADSADSSPTFEFSSPGKHVAFKCSLDHGRFKPCSSPTTFHDVSDGGHSFQVIAIDGERLQQGMAAFLWVVDTHRPKVSGFTQGIARGASIVQTDVPLAFKWTASDASTSSSRLLGSLEARFSQHGASYGDWLIQVYPTKGLHSAQVLASATSGSYIQWRARATDPAGNTRTSSPGDPFRVGLVEDAGPFVQYSSGWSQVDDENATGGTLHTSSQQDAYALVPFRLKYLGVVMRKDPSLGKARICVDPLSADADCSTVDLGSGTGERTVVFTRGPFDPGETHELSIAVESGRVDFDALAVLY